MKNLNYIIIPLLALILSSAVIPFIIPLTSTASFTENYRIPYSMGDDYYLYKIYSEYTASGKSIPFIGDSVIWGHYTDSESTLPAELNRLNKNIKFSNMGLDGIHPAAMNGLISNYGGRFKNRKIIAGINLLWMSSPRHDLTGPVNIEINHSRLLSQFSPEIPSYKPPFEEKLTALVSRSIPVFSWIEHIRLTRLADKNFYRWTMENPEKSAMEYFSRKEDDFKAPVGINPDRMQEQNIEWITPDKSLQWRFMIDTLALLKNNGNNVAAVITPFNTYMMTENSRKRYFSILSEMEWQLREKGIVPVVPLILPKKYFADSSHPTAGGYRIIAEDIMKNREFAEFIR